MADAHSVDGAAYRFSDFGRRLAPHRWAAAPVAIPLQGGGAQDRLDRGGGGSAGGG